MSLRLLHYSDVENAYDDPERVGRLAGTIRDLDGPDAIVCGTGDTTAPGVLALQTRGEQAIDFYERVGTAVETFGNHDFDFGYERTLELVERSPQHWLSANVYHPADAGTATDGGDARADERFGDAVGVDPLAVHTVNGHRVGFFGLTDPSTPDINPHARALAFTDPVVEAERAVAELRERGVDFVVCLSHLGRGDEELAASVDVDVVLGGHVHSERVEYVDDTVLTRPGVNGRVALEVSLPDKEVTRHLADDGPVDEPLATRLRDRFDTTGLTDVLATVEDPVERTEKTCFRGESRIGNFVADAYRWAAREAGYPEPIVGLQNSGGIREGPALAGEVTLADLVSVIPFEEGVAVLELTGDELLGTLAEADASVGFGDAEADWWHAHVSNVRLEYDHGDGELVSATVAGDPVDPTATYRVATSEYLLHTAGEFPSLHEGQRVDTLDTQYEVLAAYARAVGVDPELEGRIVRTGL
ncbi:5'-nucleotidase C-terminal domain-containing protein [Salinirubellus salinus]|uniref:5'-nucleotidase C-terminal domain-containing protein n=1 Tax=Salinirubellus salinus TaxID=1364945 RepID=A0A9E7U9T3_9EURY|nr:bifunctional metallophosphatase/5'-nucleotidase [Salinirubellus salinus]UWM56281.1 5'-nucleotidase C-terminal domain-containing protein [Salinirubellus salinus]